MKKITLILLSIGLSVAVYAQTPLRQTKSAVFEFSDTWCTPCGAYGVDVADSLEAQLVQANKGYLIGVKTTSTPAALNAVGGDAMFDNFAIDGIPDFIINNKLVNDGCTHNNAGDVARMMQKVAHFDSTEAAGGIAALLSVTGNMLTVTAKSKFWNATTGSYYMSVLLAEDHVSATQTAYPNNPCLHANVLRGAMATTGTALAASPWGESIGTGSIAAGQEFTKIFKVNIDATWNAANLRAFAVIFRKKTNDTFEVVNIEKAVSVATSVSELSKVKDISVYPNPATDKISIAINALEPFTVDTRITDAQGKLVYSKEHIPVEKGGNNLQIKTGNLPGGNYILILSNDKMGAITRNIVIK